MARRIQRAVVVFPQPLSPTSDSVSPWFRKKLTSSTAFTRPTVFCRRPLRIGKYFFSPLTSSSTDLREAALVILVRVRSLVEKATDSSTVAELLKPRDVLVAAAGNRCHATRMERAAGGPVERVRNRSADGRKPQPGHRLDARNRLQQSLRIR